jgi:hypothetical protein
MISRIDRINSNFQQIKLSDEDMKAVSAIGENNHTRFNIPIDYEPSWNIAIFGGAISKVLQISRLTIFCIEPEEKSAKYTVKVQ